MNIFADTYRLADAPQQLAESLIDDSDAPFSHLGRAKLACIFSERALFVRGARAAAFVAQPMVQGVQRPFYEWAMAGLCRPLFEGRLPDFVIYFDRAWWDGLPDVGRERLVFHELKHIAQKTDEFGSPKFSKETGEPLLRLVPHDTELFDDELARYGVAVCDAEHTAIAIADGEAQLRAREKQIA